MTDEQLEKAARSPHPDRPRGAQVSPAELEAIRARLNAATPGSWRVGPGLGGSTPNAVFGGDRGRRVVAACVRDNADAILIAHAPSDIRDLLDYVQSGREHVDRLHSLLWADGYRPCASSACNCGSWHGDGARARLRSVAQKLIEVVGAGGPVDAEDAAERAVAAVLERDRLRALLDAETGRGGPEGWVWDGSGWLTDDRERGVRPITGLRSDGTIGRVWQWSLRVRAGECDFALEAMEAATAAREGK